MRVIQLPPTMAKPTSKLADFFPNWPNFAQNGTQENQTWVEFQPNSMKFGQNRMRKLNRAHSTVFKRISPIMAENKITVYSTCIVLFMKSFSAYSKHCIMKRQKTFHHESLAEVLFCEFAMSFLRQLDTPPSMTEQNGTHKVVRDHFISEPFT
jgi:hypothetical protein